MASNISNLTNPYNNDINNIWKKRKQRLNKDKSMECSFLVNNSPF